MKRVIAVLLALAVAFGLGMLARRYLLSTVRIEGVSMENTLRADDVVLMLRTPFTPKRGDIVECYFDGRSDSNVKRVIGLPGEEIVFADGVLYVDGIPTSEKYVSSATEDYSVALGEDEYLLLGDNRAESYDSRAEDMGCVHRNQIVGRAICVAFPWSRIGWIG